jgi:pyruvate formate lyase activating enzyme
VLRREVFVRNQHNYKALLLTERPFEIYVYLRWQQVLIHKPFSKGGVMKRADFQRVIDEEKKSVECYLCAHNCRIKKGKRGLCQVRENRDGVLYSLVYGKLISQNVDPIEKKPLFHLLPGSLSYSIATVGCNFRCSHCQNYDISQYPRLHSGSIIGNNATPEEIVTSAQEYRRADNIF